MQHPTNQPSANFTCGAPINTGLAHYVLDAAFYRLNRWVAKGIVPPVAPRLQTTGVSPVVFATDANGNVLGGIRTPAVDAPVATLSGRSTGGTSFCFLFGSTVPFTPAQLEVLYPNHAQVRVRLDQSDEVGAQRPGSSSPRTPRSSSPPRSNPTSGSRSGAPGGAASFVRDGCQTRTMSDTTNNTARQPWSRAADEGHRLAGKRAFVTGAGTTPDGDFFGIGEAIAVLFAAQGAKVAIADISPERAEATLRLIEDVGGEAVVAIGDLTIARRQRPLRRGGRRRVRRPRHRRQQRRALRRWRQPGRRRPRQLGPGDGGQPPRRGAHRAPRDSAHRDAGGGAIINISSIAASRGHGSGAYAASKAAMLGLTRDWAYLHGRDGIRVNCILLGHVYTPMGARAVPMYASPSPRRPARDRGAAWDVAWPAVFLASEESRWITGVELPSTRAPRRPAAYALEMLNERHPA